MATVASSPELLGVVPVDMLLQEEGKNEALSHLSLLQACMSWLLTDPVCPGEKAH